MKNKIKVKLNKVKIEKDSKANVQEIPFDEYKVYKESKYKNYGQWKKESDKNAKKNS